MVDVYNLYLGGYLPKVSPKSSVHKKSELKNKYKSIVSLNNANPLVMIKLTGDTQAYALNVKEMSMELGEAAQEALNNSNGDASDKLQNMTGLFNKLLAKSDEFGEKNGWPSRPGGELRGRTGSVRLFHRFPRIFNCAGRRNSFRAEAFCGAVERKMRPYEHESDGICGEKGV